MTTAIYESQAAAESAATGVQSIWSELGGLMSAAPTPNHFENVRDWLA